MRYNVEARSRPSVQRGKHAIACVVALLLGCGPTEPPPPPELWTVSGGAGLLLTDFATNFSPSITGIQILLDGKVISTETMSPTILANGGFSRQLSVGTHKMQLKLVSQTRVSVQYTVNASMQTYNADYSIRGYFSWPERVVTLQAGDVIDFVFQVPL